MRPVSDRFTKFTLLALALSILCVVVTLLAGIGNRLEWLHFRTSLTIFRYSAMVAAAAALLSAAFLIASLLRTSSRRRNASISLIGLVLALAIVLPAYGFSRIAARVPRIHDITTDTEDPPRFHAARSYRKESDNSLDYAGAELAAQQKAYYVNVKPLELELSFEDSFSRALAAARAEGWRILDSRPEHGAIEAMATSFFFGFRDDIVVRVRGIDKNLTRIDVRSASRVGVSDLGANARRIERFLTRVRKAEIFPR